MARAGSTAAGSESESGGESRRVLSEVVADWIAQRVLDGTYPAGGQLPPERTLAEQLGVNRSSVREALKKLQQLRLVSIQQGSGIRVCPIEHASVELIGWLLVRGGQPDPARILELTELRNVLFEGLIALGIERATSQEVDEFARLIEKLASPAISQQEAATELNRAYEMAVRMSHNELAIMLWNSLRRFLELPTVWGARESARLARLDLGPGLRRLAAAVAARDRETTARALREVFRRSQELIAAQLQNQTARSDA